MNIRLEGKRALVSDVASYVNGRMIFVDGGMTDYPGFAHGD